MSLHLCSLILICLINCTLIVSFDENFEYYKKLWDFNAEESRKWKNPTQNIDFKGYDVSNCLDYGSYDFVIVGGGSAGAVLANRLSENANWEILLVEAGDDETAFSLIPAAVPILLKSNLNWGYVTTPQQNACYEMENQQCEYKRGKALGGSSAVNIMMHTRGNRQDFDEWEMMGNAGWSYDHVLPYFIKMENSSLYQSCDKYHGKDGPLNINTANESHPIFDYIVKGNEELGLKLTDYNGEKQIGVSLVQTTIKNGKRQSTNQAYIKPIRYRKNLHIVTRALAISIKFTDGKVVERLIFLHNHKCHYVKAEKELILSAGSFNTPQLLMLSGVGPSHELEKLKIPIIANLPVGQHLEDHPMILALTITTNLQQTQFSFNEKLEMFLKGEGEMGSTGDIALVFKQFTASINKQYPDVQFILRVTDFDDFLRNHETIKLNVAIMLLHPKSIGEVTLKSSNFLDFPLLNPNLLDHPDDAEILYASIEYIQKLIETKSMKKIHAKIEKIANCDGLSHREYWNCVIKYKTIGVFHPIGTCRMGVDVTTSVVNNKLQVHGMEKLRVVDASVIPTSTSGNTNSVAIMIAEKISDEMKCEYGERKQHEEL